MYLMRSCRAVLTLLFTTLLVAGCGGQTAEEHLAEAREYVAEDEPRAAVIELKNALRKDPQSGPAHALLGEIRYQQGDLPNALKNLKKALDLGVQTPDLQLNLLNVKLGLGRYSEVIGELEGQSDLSPAQQIALAEAYLLAEDVSKAKALLQNNLQLADGLLGMSKVAFLQNDLKRALSYVQQAVEKEPQHASAWLFKGELELIASDTDAALASFAQAEQIPLANINARIGQVRALLIANDLEAARKIVDKLAGKGGGGPQASYLQAVISYRQDDLQAAEDALDVVNEFAKDNLQAMYLTGVVYYRQGKLPLAERSLRRYLKEDDSNVPVRKLLAAIANEAGGDTHVAAGEPVVPAYQLAGSDQNHFISTRLVQTCEIVEVREDKEFDADAELQSLKDLYPGLPAGYLRRLLTDSVVAANMLPVGGKYRLMRTGMAADLFAIDSQKKINLWKHLDPVSYT